MYAISYSHDICVSHISQPAIRGTDPYLARNESKKESVTHSFKHVSMVISVRLSDHESKRSGAGVSLTHAAPNVHPEGKAGAACFLGVPAEEMGSMDRRPRGLSGERSALTTRGKPAINALGAADVLAVRLPMIPIESAKSDENLRVCMPSRNKSFLVKSEV